MIQPGHGRDSQSLDLGRAGEHLAREVVIPLNDIAIGVGKALLLHQRSGDHAPYPVESVTQGMNLIWPVTNADTGAYGYGQAEVRWLGEDGSIIKSQVYRTITQSSMQEPDKPPEGTRSHYGANAIELAFGDTPPGCRMEVGSSPFLREIG